MLEWVISSAVLTAIVIVLRLILKGKMSLRLQYALWAIVLVRLLVPVSFGSTGMSVQNVISRPAVEQAKTREFTPISEALENPYDAPLYMPPEVAETFYDAVIPNDVGQIEAGEAPYSASAVKTASEGRADEPQPLTANEILNIVWACGAGLIALWLLITNLQFYFRLRKSRKPLDADGAPLPVYVTDQIDTPCLFGLIRPKIYVTPEVAQDADVLRYSIEHEATHRRHGDHLWAILRALCLAIHWYNPLVWVAAVLSRNDAELACDEATIHRIGEEHRVEYGRTLIQLTCEKRPAIFVAATTMTGSGRSIKERIKLIVKKPKTAVITLIAILLVIAIAVGCTFTGAKTDKETEETTAPTETTEATAERAELDASDIPALLDAIDLTEATVNYNAQGWPVVAYRADAATHAERYLNELKQYIWVKYSSADVKINELIEDFDARLTAQNTTMIFYGPARNCMVCVETDDAEGWFLPSRTEDDEEASDFVAVFDLMGPWYEEAEAATRFGKEGRLLTAEELDAICDYTANHITATADFSPRVGVENGSVVTLWGFLPPAVLDGRDPYYRAMLQKSGDGWTLLSFEEEKNDAAPAQRAELDASDIPALLDAIDLTEATLTYHSGSSTSGEDAYYPAAAAIGAERYLERIKEIPWQDCEMRSENTTKKTWPYFRLTAPHTTVTFYYYATENECEIHVEKDGAEIWLRYPTDEIVARILEARDRGEDLGTLRTYDSYFQNMCSWFHAAYGATVYGGNGRLLTVKELEFFADYTDAYQLAHNPDPEGENRTIILNLEIGCFLTSTYSDVRDMEAQPFLECLSAVDSDGLDRDTVPIEKDGRTQLAHRVTRARANEVLMKYAGVTVEDMHTNWFEEVTYDPDTGCFFPVADVWNTRPAAFDPTVGVESGDVVTLWTWHSWVYLDPLQRSNTDFFTPAHRMTLQKSGDGWYILSYTTDKKESASIITSTTRLPEPKEMPVELTDAVESLCASGDVSLSLIFADGGKWGTYPWDAKTNNDLWARLSNYNWTRLDAPPAEQGEYWLTADSADGTKRMTFWDDGGAGTVEYSDGTASSFWKASQVYLGALSITKRIREEFDHKETNFAGVSFRVDGTAEDAAEYFVTTAVGEHMRSLEPWNGFGADDYEVVLWKIIDVSENGRTVKGSFECAVAPRHPESTDIRAGNTRDGTGRYAGKFVFDRTFVLELQDDGLWHCVEFGTG